MESKNGDTDDQMSASYCFPRAGMFPGHCINTSSNSIERPCLVFEDLSKLNNRELSMSFRLIDLLCVVLLAEAFRRIFFII